MMLPGEFLPQARQFGVMATIDRFMVARAIELSGAGRLVAVNLWRHPSTMRPPSQRSSRSCAEPVTPPPGCPSNGPNTLP